MTKTELLALPYDEYLKSSHWLAVRRMMMGMYPHCALCRSNSRLNVHHNSYKNKGAETHVDLIVLCSDCHARFHGKANTQKANTLTNVVPIAEKEVDPNIERVERLFFYYLKRQARVTNYTEEYINRHPLFIDIRYFQCLRPDAYSKYMRSQAWLATLLFKLLINSFEKNNKLTMGMHSGYIKKDINCNGIIGIKKTLETIFNPDYAKVTYIHKTNNIELVFNQSKFKSPVILSGTIVSSEMVFGGALTKDEYRQINDAIALGNDMAAQIKFIKAYAARVCGRAVSKVSYNDSHQFQGWRIYPTFKEFFDGCGVKMLVNEYRPKMHKINHILKFF